MRGNSKLQRLTNTRTSTSTSRLLTSTSCCPTTTSIISSSIKYSGHTLVSSLCASHPALVGMSNMASKRSNICPLSSSVGTKRTAAANDVTAPVRWLSSSTSSTASSRNHPLRSSSVTRSEASSSTASTATASGGAPGSNGSGSGTSSASATEFHSGFEDDRAQTMATLTVDSHGEVIEGTEVEKQVLARRYGLHNRDLRNLDATFRNIPSILARKKVIVVNLDAVKALISSDNLVLFEHDRVPEFVPNLKKRLEDSELQPIEERSQFEFIALEAILITVCDGLEHRFGQYRNAVQGVLDQHQRDKNEAQALNSLRPLKYGLAEFHMTVKESARAVDAVLKSDEDMSEMYLTEKALTTTRREIQAHEEMEVLLETYFRKIQELENELTTLSRNIVDTENEIQILLDSNRNSIMKMELQLSINAVAVASGALIAGAFGMNLTSGLEHTQYAFLITAGVLTGVTAVTRYHFIRSCRRVNIHFDHASMFIGGAPPRFAKRGFMSTPADYAIPPHYHPPGWTGNDIPTPLRLKNGSSSSSY